MDNKKMKVVFSIILLLLLVGVGYYLVSRNDNTDNQVEEENTAQTNQDSNQQESEPDMPSEEMTFSYYDSTEAFEAVEKAALEWQSDAVFNKCNGLTMTSMETPTKTYEFVAGEDGTYRSWFCEYYSPSQKQTMIITYDGEVETAEPLAIGQYSESQYNHGTNPKSVSELAEAKKVYAKVDTHLDNYYYNMRAKYISDYGFVWTVEEMSKTELDEYDMNKTVNTYIFDAFTGELKDTVDREVY